jgi:acyl-CoA hydrolase
LLQINFSCSIKSSHIKNVSRAPEYFDDADAIAEAIVRAVGTNIVLALPLGLGKANHVANALYARAAADRSIHLEIITALTLEKPKASSEIERRFLEPLSQRLFDNYPALTYAEALHQDALPPNIEVSEFFFLAGRWLTVPAAQQHYISANYTHAARYVIERGVNVIAQLVAKRTVEGEIRYSLSCNTDLTLDLLKARAKGEVEFKLVGQVNSELPFMPGDGDLATNSFSHILDSPSTDFALFAPPKQPIGLTEYAIGIHVARLIPDGGTLQIGIGQESDAAAQCLILRHKENAVFREVVGRLSQEAERLPHYEYAKFLIGLHGTSEMFVDAFLPLIDAGVLKREVDGALLHAAFFLGPRSFYRALREMPASKLCKLRMTAISFTNELYGDEEIKRRARVKARFINSAFMATLMGAVDSDQLEDGRVVSGVGGQFNFVNQAFALKDARSIIMIKSTHSAGGKTTSNIRWSYGHETIPRHLRDIVVTEYGIADLRGKSDRDVIAAMLSVTDSRFQTELLRQAKGTGKIEASYEIPRAQSQNSPARIEGALDSFRTRGFLVPFPFGTDFTEVEQRLLPVLRLLQSASSSTWQMLHLAARGLLAGEMSPDDAACLARLVLTTPTTIPEHFYRALIRGSLRRTRAE